MKLDICELFKRIESETKTEISFPDKFLLAHYNNTEGLFYKKGSLCQHFDFFTEDLSDFLFVQEGNYVTFKALTPKVPFWGIEKSPRRIGESRMFLHQIYYCNSGN